MLAAVIRWTMPAELPDELLGWLGYDSDGFSTAEAAALACDLPAVTAVNDPPAPNSAEFRGALVISGGGEMPAAVSRRFLELAGRSTARLVIIPTATDDKYIASDSKEETAFWKKHGFREIEVLHTRSRDVANSPEFVAPLRRATAVWIDGGRQTLLAAAYSDTLVERELHALLERGGVIGGTSAGAACLSRIMIVRGHICKVPGFGLLPGTIIDQHFVKRNRMPRLLAALQKRSGWVGLGIDEGAAAVVTRDSLQCIGNSTVTLCLAETLREPMRETVLSPGQTASLIAWRNEAIARTVPSEREPREVAIDIKAEESSSVGAGGQ